MKLSLEFYEHLRNRINISDVIRQKVTLSRKSGNYVGLCPFHKEKTPSFTVNDPKRFYYCFGCTASGDVIKFTANISGLSYNESAIKLANDYGIEIPKLNKQQQKFYEESDKILEVLELANKFYMSQLTPNTLNYLNSRNISNEIIKEFSIGFAPNNKKLINFLHDKEIDDILLSKAGLIAQRENTVHQIFNDRIIFPIRNIYNKIIGFGGRVINEKLPKYLNSPETIVFQKNETLYGEHKAISSVYKKNYSILVEGYFDVIALHQAGFSEAMASLGTAVTENHLHKLWRAGDEIILCLDGDSAGFKASIRIINLALPLINSTKKISFIRLPIGLDPDDLINKRGAKFFQIILEKRITLSEMIWFIEYNDKFFHTAESIATLEKNLKNYSDKIIDKNLRINYYRFFKDQVWHNLISTQTKRSRKNTSASLPISHNYSEIEILEYSFCSILIQFSEILKNHQIKDFLFNLNFKNKLLEEFRNWYFLEVIDKNVKYDEIIPIVEKTSFLEIFLLLSKTDNLFINIPLNKDTIQLDLFWQWIQKKYHLINLKQEYMTITQSTDNNKFDKALLYQKEIFKISSELQILNQSFIN